MVSFFPMGRCGNFIFQAAATIGYAKKHNLIFTMPSRRGDPAWHPSYFQHLTNPDYRELAHQIINEAHHCYYELPVFHDAEQINIFLRGYFQSYLYFDFCREDLLKLFGIPYSFEAGQVSIHVRRGDYLLYPTINPLATRTYYEQAVEYFWLKGYTRFKVFSDDIPWCIDEFQDECYKGCQFEFSQSKSDMEDLSLMSGCEHNIIGNSTFSWWGAWLNQNPAKIVVCPHEDNYYGPANKHLDVSTLYPPDWIRLKY